MRLEALGKSASQYPGESFVVRWQDSAGTWPTTAVVDVGGARTGLAATAAAARPDVVVLTHSDADHVGGWPEFCDGFEGQSLGLPQVWLPSDWALVVQCVLAAFSPDDQPLAGFDPTGVSSQIARLRRSTKRCGCGAGRPSRCGGCQQGADLLRNLLDRLRQELNGATRHHFRDVLYGVLAERFAELAAKDDDFLGRDSPRAVTKGSTEAFSKIVSVVEVVADCAAGADVRWFLPRRHVQRGEQLWRRTGEPGRLTLLNAVEVVGPSGWTPTAANALPVALALTTINRRALALYAWADAKPATEDDGPFIPLGLGALITSDSPRPRDALSFPVPWEHVGIMTAPHHGSRDREHVGWWRDLPAGRRVILSNNAQDTSSAFFEVPSGLRSCTSCALRHWHGPGTRSASLNATGWSLSDDCSMRGCLRGLN